MAEFITSTENASSEDTVVFKMIGHACVLATHKNQSFLFDPWFGGPTDKTTFTGYPDFARLSQKEVEQLVGIHVSHIHFDHMGRDDIRSFRSDLPVFIGKYSRKDFFNVIKSCGREVIIEADPGVPCRTAGHFSISVFPKFPEDGTYDSSCVLSVGGMNFYFANDCIHFDTSYSLIRSQFGQIHGAFVGYAVANPAVWSTDLSICESLATKVTVDEFAHSRQTAGWSHVSKVCTLLAPKWAVPYASSYRFLNPDLAPLNRLFGVDEQIYKIELNDALPVVLKHGDCIDGATGRKDGLETVPNAIGRDLTSPVVPDKFLYREKYRQNLSKEEWPILIEKLADLFLQIFSRQSKVWTTSMKIETVFFDENCRHSLYFEFDGQQTRQKSRVELPESESWADVTMEMPGSIAKLVTTGKKSLFDVYYLFSQRVVWRRLKFGQMNFLKWV